MALGPGKHLGPYEIVAPIGAGGMGEVYRARDIRLDRTVAVKVLPSHLSQNAEMRQRFEREARAVSSLNHPHICTLHDVGQQDGVHFLVMECLEGETLAKRLERGALPAEEALRYAIQIADASDKAHRQGVVHRDLKPGNIMLTKSGAKLLDFGLAKSAHEAAPPISSAVMTQASPLTVEGTIVGTFQYMAPEQLEGEAADARSDIFAFGTVVYEMVTGRKAFCGKSQASLLVSVLEHEPAPISSFRPMSPPALDHVVSRCLAEDPDDRWQTASDLTRELKWITEAGSQAGVPAPVASRRRSRERFWIAATILLALVTTALAVSLFRRPAMEARTMRVHILPPADAYFRSMGASAAPPVISPDGRSVVFGVTTLDGKNWSCPDSVDG
ncbi:MAG: serine/threonine-protein kinase [Acidobacteriota bacterium]